MEQLYDVLIIGGGVVGSAIAREMARYRLKIGVLEKNLDVCCETSGRNSGVVHAGYADKVGTLKAKLCVEGNRLMDQLAQELEFPFQRCGKVVVGSTPEDMEALRESLEQGRANGATGLELVDKKRLHELIPTADAEFALYSPSSGIVDPFQYTIALAENAHKNGVRYHLDHEVTDIARDGDGNYHITTPRGQFSSRWVVNAAGLGCGKISDMLGIKGYKIVGHVGEYIILDKRTGPLLPMPIYPSPRAGRTGIHLTNTIDGNVLVGPGGTTTMDLGDYSVSAQGMEDLLREGNAMWPHIRRQDYIRSYGGLLAKRYENGVIQDFLIEIRDDLAPRAINLVGIESPGLTSAVAIARHAISLMREREELEENPAFDPTRKAIVRLRELPLEAQESLIRENPDYGELVCRCEKVTRAELLQAIRNPLGVHTMAGIKYRTRSMMGRCQGGYCQMRLARMIEEETGGQPTDIRHARSGGQVFFGKVRQEAE